MIGRSTIPEEGQAHDCAEKNGAHLSPGGRDQDRDTGRHDGQRGAVAIRR